MYCKLGYICKSSNLPVIPENNASQIYVISEYKMTHYKMDKN